MQIFENVEIVDISTEGKGIGKVNGVVCFVDYAIPGDVVNIQVAKKKRNYREAKIIKHISFSEKRTEAACQHFGVCGGCKWQNMDYQAQLFFKQKTVRDALTRIGGVALSEVAGTEGELLPILPSLEQFHYRNKLEYTFSNKKWLSNDDFKKITLGENLGSAAYALGFHIPKLFDKVLDIAECHLQADPSNAIRLEVRKYAIDNKLTFFDIRKQDGFLRNLILRSASTGEWMVVVCFFYEDQEAREALLNHIHNKFSEIVSLQYVVNAKKNDSIFDQEVVCYKGKDHIVEVMPPPSPEQAPLKFQISAKSFFQTNSRQAFELYKVTSNYCDFKGDEIVYDLYTGTGTIANFVARSVQKVVGVEYIEQAIIDAKINATLNQINNTSFFAGDIKDILNADFVATQGTPDVIIVDPPRAGMHEDVVNKILEITPDRIVYVSCNPATQARDIALMKEKYTVAKVQPIDMFPHTAHVESVVKLIRN